ncbi:4'-phosphopantetheinyl transferase family protein [Caldimonas tepidiphila]|uniref:4'-phosphopantetheinyl transferase family protein n=1 Tax=Caldimonas tepidiphila TaxID=2315841 RepID=UPI000E5C4611|nr:4'-phosphopantetheinyl transferase superfamily protein [Caldimonas tepidiphila]
MTELVPPPAPIPLRLWCVRLDREPPAAALQNLSHEELERAARFVFERDRRRHLAAHCALREILARATGREAAWLRFESGPHGKPALAPAASRCSFNMSHSEDLALIAVAPRGELGVDVEVLREVPDALPLAERHFTARERQELLRAPAGAARHLAFLRGWTRKEACLKALGTGLSLEAAGFETGLAPEARRVRIRDLDGRPVEVHVQSLGDVQGAVGALACVVT